MCPLPLQASDHATLSRHARKDLHHRHLAVREAPHRVGQEVPVPLDHAHSLTDPRLGLDRFHQVGRYHKALAAALLHPGFLLLGFSAQQPQHRSRLPGPHWQVLALRHSGQEQSRPALSALPRPQRGQLLQISERVLSGKGEHPKLARASP